jgi:hypothetical protein
MIPGGASDAPLIGFIDQVRPHIELTEARAAMREGLLGIADGRRWFLGRSSCGHTASRALVNTMPTWRSSRRCRGVLGLRKRFRRRTARTLTPTRNLLFCAISHNGASSLLEALMNIGLPKPPRVHDVW